MSIQRVLGLYIGILGDAIGNNSSVLKKNTKLNFGTL